MRAAAISVLLALSLAACQSGEDGVITNKAPFFQRQYHLPIREAGSVVSEIQAFAAKNKLKLLLSKQHFKESEFVATLINDRLNIITNNVARGDEVWVTAISRDNPSIEDERLLNKYLSEVSFNE